MILGHDVGAPAIGAAIVGRLLGVKTMTGPVTLMAAAGPVDVTGNGRAPHRRLGRAHHHGGAGRPPDGINEEMERGGIVIDGGETFV